ncbi:major facilitator superfamily domain-containing protein [Phakopsora pachyrhizi]|nr:major facilitator superfamily domain-containing protein [Phakopsora pachyrhizi]
MESINQTTKSRKWLPSTSEARLLLIASTGFFIDAYDLFTINLVVPILNIRYNNQVGSSLQNAVLVGGLLKAGANIGCIVGQILFGALGDIYGRKKIYPTSLAVTIIGTILTIAAPDSLGSSGVFAWITFTRILMGIGIGGDYPMSGSVVSDRANNDRRGMLLAFTFAMQGWGNFVGAIVSMIVLSVFKSSIEGGNLSNFDAVWRIILGFILIPSIATMYQRLKLPESDRMTEVLRKRKENKSLEGSKSTEALSESKELDNPHKLPEGFSKAEKNSAKKEYSSFTEFREYFSEWRHLKHLIGTTACWFFVDISFYGIALNQSTVVSAIINKTINEPWQSAFDNTKANLIITIAGFLPGYYFTMFFIEYLGRKKIQAGGFLLEAILLAVIAADHSSLSHKPAGFIVCFALLQFFFNFGANATTFIYASELYPTRVRSLASGFSAAGGKLGAVLSALGFSQIANDYGTPTVLWILVGTSICGLAFTFMLPETKGYDADAIDEQERAEKIRQN